MMKYIIVKPVAGDIPEIEISEEAYLAYKEAVSVLSNCLAIEEKYEILITNYVDLETQMLNTAVSNMTRDNISYSSFFDIRLILNVRLVNILTAARLYTDQVYRHVKKCLPSSADVNPTIKSLLSAEYDSHQDYRFMEALRNYVQHNDVAIHGISLPSRWTDMGEDGMLEYSVEFDIQKKLLEASGDFKRKVLDELPDKVDLKVATRRYIESLSNVHNSIRELIAEKVAESRQLIEDAHYQYRQVYDVESLTGLSACKVDGVRLVETVLLLLEWDEMRIGLQRRNPQLINLHKRYATSRVNTPKRKK